MFLMGHLDNRVILDNIDVSGRCQESYPDGFVSLSLFLAEIKGFVVMVKNVTYNIQTSDIHQTLQKFNIDEVQ